MSKFSIIVPVYKTELYLNTCVQSVICQTFKDFELILVDDGSPDNCGCMCDEWAIKDNRIRVIHQENGGLSAARNAGIRNAKGEYVLFLDSDDWWADESVLSGIVQQLERTAVDVLSFNYCKSYYGKLEEPYFGREVPTSVAPMTIAEAVCGGIWITGACNKAIRRCLLVENDLYFKRGITSEDIDWTLRLGLKGETFGFVNLCVFVYRQHRTSISHTTTAKSVCVLKDNVKECVRLLETAEEDKAESLNPFVAYQYGTLLHNAANLPAADRTEQLMEEIRTMRWLLNCSEDRKIKILRQCCKCGGFSATLLLLRLRQKLLNGIGRGV